MSEYTRWQLPVGQLPSDRHDFARVTSDCRVRAYVSYADYYERLGTLIPRTDQGDEIFIAGWEFNPDQPLGSKTTKDLLEEAIKKGVRVRVLLSARTFDPKLNQKAVATIKALKGEAALDAQHQGNGTMHQKAVYLTAKPEPKKPPEPHLFLGGMDVTLNREGFWHDAQAEVIGEGAKLGFATLEERWYSVTKGVKEIPAAPTQGDNHTLVQFVRTYGKPDAAAKKNGRVYAPDGDFSVHALLSHAIGVASNFIYIEDQYVVGCRDDAGNDLKKLTSLEDLLAKALQDKPKLNVIVVFPRSAQVDGEGWKPWIRRKRLIDTLTRNATKPRVRILQYQEKYTPDVSAKHTNDFFQNYIHTKVWVFDDQLAVVGSANYNRSGLSNEGEFDVGIASDKPVDSGPGKGFVFARALRMELWLAKLNAPGTPGGFDKKDVEDWPRGLEAFLGMIKGKTSPFEEYDPNADVDHFTYNGDPDGSDVP